jgi:hypothetical protein
MRPITAVAGQELLWVQPVADQRAYELRAGEEVVATLGWQRRSLAVAEAAGHLWTFKRQGLWHPRVTVRAAGTDVDVAVFHPSWMGGGTLELAPGRRLVLRWQTEWVWQDEVGATLVHFTEGPVEITPSAASLSDLSLLVLLGWYLLVLFAEDAAFAGAATGVMAVG